MLGKLIHVIKVLGGVIQVIFVPVLPIKSEPANAVFDGIDVFLIFFNRVRIVKAHMTQAAVITRQTEIQTNGFGMSDMQIPIGFRRKTRADASRVGFALGQLHGIRSRMSAPIARKIIALGQVLLDNRSNEIDGLCRCRFFFFDL